MYFTGMYCCEKYIASMTLRIILAVMLLLCTYRANSQNNVKFRSRYVINTPVVDTTLADKSARISDMRIFFEMMRDDTTTQVTDVRFRGTSSPDGGYEFNRWRMEFTMGTGIYPLDYRVFDNTPCVKGCQRMFRNQKKHIGFDRADISFAYSFDMEHSTHTHRMKGGRR